MLFIVFLLLLFYILIYAQKMNSQNWQPHRTCCVNWMPFLLVNGNKRLTNSHIFYCLLPAIFVQGQFLCVWCPSFVFVSFVFTCLLFSHFRWVFWSGYEFIFALIHSHTHICVWFHCFSFFFIKYVICKLQLKYVFFCFFFLIYRHSILISSYGQNK